MKDNKEDVGATAFDLPNSQNPYGAHPVYYGNKKMGNPQLAKMKSQTEMMRSANKGK